MIAPFARSLRHFVAGVFATILILSLPIAAQAQDANDPAVIVQQANTVLSSQADAGTPATINTRLTLTKRHEKLIELFLKHPELARMYALNAKTHAFMMKADPSYAALIEQDVPLTGQLAVAEADDFAHHTSTKHYSLHGFTGDRGLSFATVPPQLEKLAGHNVTITGLSLPEVVAAETVVESPHAAATPEAFAVTPAAQSNAVVTPAATQTITSIGTGVPTGSATTVDSTFGNQTTAVLILKFASGTAVYPAGTDAQAPYLQTFQGPATPNVNEFLKEVSYNQTFMSTDVYTTLTVPGSFDCLTTDAMATAAIPVAIAAGLDVSK